MQWWLIGGLLCGGLAVAAVVGLILLGRIDTRNRQRTLEKGEPTVGWIIQANNNLFEEGHMDYPALVLISPDEETANDEEFMTDLAGRIMELKGERGGDEDEEFVSGLVTDERYREGKRDRLPKSFAGRRKVYAAHAMIYREDLPGGKLDRPSVRLSVIWDEPGSLISTRPHRRKERRDEEY
jgi:hypothetical protein